jgi:hypothetical protein
MPQSLPKVLNDQRHFLMQTFDDDCKTVKKVAKGQPNNVTSTDK